jgi:hypothetical protein
LRYLHAHRASRCGEEAFVTNQNDNSVAIVDLSRMALSLATPPRRLTL